MNPSGESFDSPDGYLLQEIKVRFLLLVCSRVAGNATESEDVGNGVAA